MKYILSLFLFSLLVLTLNSCEKDEGKLPEISFKTGGSYTSSDATVAEGDTVLIGIHAQKTEEEDVLKKLNISSSLDGGTPATLSDTNLTGADEDQFDADFSFPIVAGSAGHNFKLTFTVTNRDGLTNHVALTLTVN